MEQLVPRLKRQALPGCPTNLAHPSRHRELARPASQPQSSEESAYARATAARTEEYRMSPCLPVVSTEGKQAGAPGAGNTTAPAHVEVDKRALKDERPVHHARQPQRSEGANRQQDRGGEGIITRLRRQVYKYTGGLAGRGGAAAGGRVL